MHRIIGLTRGPDGQPPFEGGATSSVIAFKYGLQKSACKEILGRRFRTLRPWRHLPQTQNRDDYPPGSTGSHTALNYRDLPTAKSHPNRAAAASLFQLSFYLPFYIAHLWHYHLKPKKQGG